MVDYKKIAFNPAVEISYLKKDEQEKLYDSMEKYQATPSQQQAIEMKKLSQRLLALTLTSMSTSTSVRLLNLKNSHSK